MARGSGGSEALGFGGADSGELECLGRSPLAVAWQSGIISVGEGLARLVHETGEIAVPEAEQGCVSEWRRAQVRLCLERGEDLRNSVLAGKYGCDTP